MSTKHTIGGYYFAVFYDERGNIRPQYMAQVLEADNIEDAAREANVVLKVVFPEAVRFELFDGYCCGSGELKDG